MTRRKKYLLTGYLGANNLGDECMLRRFLQLFDPYPEVSFTVFSYGLCYDSQRIETRYHRDSEEERWREILDASRDVDGVVWVGGNCFTDFDGDGEFRLLVRCKLSGKRFYYAGVGIDDMQRTRRRIKTMMALNLADGLIMRDDFSLSLARGWCLAKKKIAFGPDLGELYLRDLATPAAETGPAAIAVSWRNLEKKLPGSHAQVVERLAEELALMVRDDGSEILIFHTDDRMDPEANRYLARCLRQHGVRRLTLHEGLSLEGKLSLIAAASAVVTARLHTGVAGVRYGKPTAIFNYSKKVERFAARAGERVVTLSGPEDFSALRQLLHAPVAGEAATVDSVGSLSHPLAPSGKGRGDTGSFLYVSDDDTVYRDFAARLAGAGEAGP